MPVFEVLSAVELPVVSLLLNPCAVEVVFVDEFVTVLPVLIQDLEFSESPP